MEEAEVLADTVAQIISSGKIIAMALPADQLTEQRELSGCVHASVR